MWHIRCIWITSFLKPLGGHRPKTIFGRPAPSATTSKAFKRLGSTQKAELTRRGLPYAVISGDNWRERFQQAVVAVYQNIPGMISAEGARLGSVA